MRRRQVDFTQRSPILVIREISKCDSTARINTGVNDTFKALADPTRREILRLLRQGDMSAGEISERFQLSNPTMSGHFNVLKAAGLIISERNRNRVVYSINTSAFDDALGAAIALITSYGDVSDDAGSSLENTNAGTK
jgi:ArsR family transcriptional regulator